MSLLYVLGGIVVLGGLGSFLLALPWMLERFERWDRENT